MHRARLVCLAGWTPAKCLETVACGRGDRFCVGSGPRYAPGQAGDAANKAKDYQFEALHKVYFYDAWKWKIELNQPDSPLRLPPRPGLLQNGCYWQRPPECVDSATCTQNTQQSAACAEVSLTETSSAESEEISPPSKVPAVSYTHLTLPTKLEV